MTLVQLLPCASDIFEDKEESFLFCTFNKREKDAIR